MLRFHSVDISDSNNLKEGDDKQRNRAHIVVKDLYPVVARTLGEDEGHRKGYQADDTWRSENTFVSGRKFKEAKVFESLIRCEIPVTTSLGIQLGTILRSLMGVRTPSMLPNIEERPKLKSMTKNSMAHTCEPGISMTASVNTMKARPVPEALWGGRQKTEWNML